MVLGIPLGCTACFSALRSGSQQFDIFTGSDGYRTSISGQLHRAEVGIHLHYTRRFRRRLLRIIPLVLQYELRRSLLAVDDDTLLVRDAGREL